MLTNICFGCIKRKMTLILCRRIATNAGFIILGSFALGLLILYQQIWKHSDMITESTNSETSSFLNIMNAQETSKSEKSSERIQTFPDEINTSKSNSVSKDIDIEITKSATVSKTDVKSSAMSWKGNFSEKIFGSISNDSQIQNPTDSHQDDKNPQERNIPKEPKERKYSIENREDLEVVNWFKKREKLLSKNKARKILLFSHMRGGSSIASQLFNKDPSAVLWHEPLSSYFMAYYGIHIFALTHNTLYTGRNFTKTIFEPYEQQNLASFFSKSLGCQYLNLRPQTWMHNFNSYADSAVMKSLVKCKDNKKNPNCGQLSHFCGNNVKSAEIKMCPNVINTSWKLIEEIPAENLTQIGEEEFSRQVLDYVNKTSQNVDRDILIDAVPLISKNSLCNAKQRRQYTECLLESEKLCKEANLHVAEVNRIKMDEIETILRTIPDLFVIHYVRDPRAIASSRNGKGVNFMLANNLSDTIKFLCKRMENDLVLRKELDRKYPGVILKLNYESLVKEPIEMAKKIYKFIGRSYPEDSRWTNFTQEAFHGNSNTEILRVNGSSSIDKWRSQFSTKEFETFKNYCTTVLKELGYSLD